MLVRGDGKRATDSASIYCVLKRKKKNKLNVGKSQWFRRSQIICRQRFVTFITNSKSDLNVRYKYCATRGLDVYSNVAQYVYVGPSGVDDKRRRRP